MSIRFRSRKEQSPIHMMASATVSNPIQQTTNNQYLIRTRARAKIFSHSNGSGKKSGIPWPFGGIHCLAGSYITMQ